MPKQPTNADLQKAFDNHAKEDHNFQIEARGFNGEMVTFKAETEGSLADIYRRLGDLPETVQNVVGKQIGKMIRWVGIIGIISILSLAAAWGKLNNQVDTNKQDIDTLRSSAVITKYDLQTAVTQAVIEAQKK